LISSPAKPEIAGRLKLNTPTTVSLYFNGSARNEPAVGRLG
jgi:hypothetical protein